VVVLNQSLGNAYLLKTIENQDFEMTLIIAGNKELLQMWYQLDCRAHPSCYGLQPTASHISGFKIWNKIYIFIQNTDNRWRQGLNSSHGSSTHNSLLFFPSPLTVTNEDILDVMFDWRTLLLGNK
jgi:hypothetical protein